MHKKHTYTIVLAVFAFIVLGASILPAAVQGAGLGKGGGSSTGIDPFSALFNKFFKPAKPTAVIVTGTVGNVTALLDGRPVPFLALLSASSKDTSGTLTSIGNIPVFMNGVNIATGFPTTGIVNNLNNPAYASGDYMTLIQSGDAVTVQGTFPAGGSWSSDFKPTTFTDRALINRITYTGTVTGIDYNDKALLLHSVQIGSAPYVVANFVVMPGDDGTVNFSRLLIHTTPTVIALSGTKYVKIPLSSVRIGDTLTTLGVSTPFGGAAPALGDILNGKFDPTGGVQQVHAIVGNQGYVLAPALILDQNPSAISGAGGPTRSCEQLTVCGTPIPGAGSK